MDQAADHLLEFIGGFDDPNPEITARHVTNGREYLGFRLTGSLLLHSRGLHLRFDHPSGMRLMVSDIYPPATANSELHQKALENFILKDIRRLMN